MWQRKIYLWATAYKVYFVAMEKKNPNYTVRKKVKTEPHRANKLHGPEGLKRILTDSANFFLSILVFTGCPKNFPWKGNH